MAKVRVRAVVEFEAEVPEGPEFTDGYDGAETLEERIAKEKEFYEDDGDYLMQALTFCKAKVTVDITPVER